MPRVSPRLLGDGFAQAASNCDFRSGRLDPSKAPLDTGVTLQTGTESIYWYNREGNGGAGFWFQWGSSVDVAKSPVPDDVDRLIYFTGAGVPKFTDITLGQSGGGPYPGASYDLGLPAPDAPTASDMSGTTPDGAQVEQTGYIMTYVDTYGYEGPPSAASGEVDRWDGTADAVELTNLSIPSGNFNVVAKRLYRLTNAGVFQFLAEIPAASTTFSDDIDNPLGEPVITEGWIAPNPNMIGMTAVPNGGLMGWWGNTVAFSVPGQPHAWPIEYRYGFDYEIVGAAVTSQGIAIVTKGRPYMLMGTGPSSYSPIQMDHVLPGISKDSVVDMGDYALYASPEGLVAVGGSSPGLVTEPHIKPEQWRERYGNATLKAVRWDDRYLGFYDGASGAAFSFRADEGFRDFDQSATAVWMDPETADVYVKQGTTLAKWGEGSDEIYEWVSGEGTIPPLARWGVAKVDADSYPVTFEFYRDGALAKSKTVTGPQSFRLPTRRDYRRFHVRVAGSSPINFIQLASGKDEIV